MSRLFALGGSTVLHSGTVGLVLLAGAWGLRENPARMAVATPPPAPVSLEIRSDRAETQPIFEVTTPLPGPLTPDDVELEVEPVEIVVPEPPAPRIAPDRPAPPLDRPARTVARVAPPAEATPSTQVESEVAPVEVYNPPPAYPPAARRRRQEGFVLVEILVRADGQATEPQVVDSAGSPLFVDEVLRVVAGWRYQPATVGGVPVDRRQQIRFVFRLE